MKVQELANIGDLEKCVGKLILFQKKPALVSISEFNKQEIRLTLRKRKDLIRRYEIPIRSLKDILYVEDGEAHFKKGRPKVNVYCYRKINNPLFDDSWYLLLDDELNKVRYKEAA